MVTWRSRQSLTKRLTCPENHTPTKANGKCAFFPARRFTVIITPMNASNVSQLSPLLYSGVLLAILVIDLRQRRVLNVLALPAAGLALLVGLANGHEPFLLALGGATVGFALFYALYWLGRKLYGTAVLGFGDVKLAMLIGAMVGLSQVLVALALGILLAGLGSAALLLSRQAGPRSMVPYGAFLAAAGMIVLLVPAF